jgi:hypothetical protein
MGCGIIMSPFGIGSYPFDIGTPSLQPTLHGLQHFGLQKAKKWARD